MCVHVRTTLAPFHACVLSQALSLVCHGVSGIRLSLPLQCWGYSCVPQCSAFSHRFWKLNSSPHVFKATCTAQSPLPLGGRSPRQPQVQLSTSGRKKSDQVFNWTSPFPEFSTRFQIVLFLCCLCISKCQLLAPSPPSTSTFP